MADRSPLDCSTSTRCSTRRTSRSSRPSASSPTTGSAPAHRRSGSRTARCRPATWPRSSASSACSACTWRATAAPGASATAVRAGLPRARGGRLRRCARWSRCRARWRCSRSTRYGSEEQKQQLAAAAWPPGEPIGCFGLTEPDSGSDPAGMRTRRPPRRRRLGPQRHQDVDHQRLDRRRRRGVGPHRRRASAASSSRPTPRASPRREITHKMSLRASVTSELVLDDVRLPGRRPMLPEVARACTGPLGCLTEARFGIIFGVDRRGPRLPRGDPGATPSEPRDQFDKPLAGFQLTQAKLADMAVELRQGDAAGPAPRPAQGRRAGIRPEQVSFGKLNNVREAHRDRPRVPHDPGRRRHHAGVPGAAARQQPRVGAAPTRAPPRCTSWCSARRSPARTPSAEPQVVTPGGADDDGAPGEGWSAGSHWPSVIAL